MEGFVFYIIVIFLGSICPAIYYIYLKLHWNLLHWSWHKIHQIQPHFVYGNLEPYIRRNVDFGVMLRNYYNESYGESCVGLYMIHKPALLLRDINLIRTIFFNDFGYFSSRKPFEKKEKCPLLDNFYQRSGSEWRAGRDLLFRAFTFENISQLYNTIVDVGALEKFCDDLIDSGDENTVCINKLLDRHLYSALAWVIYGVEIDTIRNPERSFRTFGSELFQPIFVDKLSFIRDLAVPTEWEWLDDLLNFRRHSKRVEDYFISLTRCVVNLREKDSTFLNANQDFMQYLLKIRNRGNLYDDEEGHALILYPDEPKYLSIEQVSSLAFLAFTSAFPTVRSTMVFFLYEIAKNQAIQEKLAEEIKVLFRSTRGNPDYIHVARMSYLNACVNEVFRKYPPILYLVRYCTNDYFLQEQNVLIEKGMPIFVSVLGIHHDPAYYPNPLVFNPERFNAYQIRTRPNTAFLPFGFGPRNCLGGELARAIIKLHLVFMVSRYEVHISKRMKDTEINFEKGHLNELNRIHLRFAQRIVSSSSEDED